VKITKIEAQVKTRGRYSVFIDEKFSFGISEDGLLALGLKIGRELSPQEIEGLKETAQTDKLYNMTLGLIARRPRSQWEIVDYLKRKKADPGASEEIIARLSERGYIDDEDFARRWVESRRLLKPISKRKLQMELKTKRINDEVITKVLDEDDSDELEVLQAEVDKKRRQSRYKDDEKLMQYLARQGYSYVDIKRVLSGDAG
jgi:regulatory protein